MTSEQKKQVTDAFVSFVLRITNESRGIEREEAAILPAILSFLVETDSSERLCNLIPKTMINSAVLPDLYKMVKKFAESKE